MPLSVLVIMVSLGIGGIALLTHRLGLSKPLRFANEDEIRAAWAREYPDLPAGTVTLTRRGAAGLVMTREGPGLVWPMGADSTARLLTGARARPHKKGLDISLPDPSAPQLRLILDPSEIKPWARVIEGGDKWPVS